MLILTTFGGEGIHLLFSCWLCPGNSGAIRKAAVNANGSQCSVAKSNVRNGTKGDGIITWKVRPPVQCWDSILECQFSTDHYVSDLAAS